MRVQFHTYILELAIFSFWKLCHSNRYGVLSHGGSDCSSHVPGHSQISETHPFAPLLILPWVSVELQDFFIFGHYRIHEFRHFLPPCRVFPPFSVMVLIHKRLPSTQCFHSFTTVTAALDNFSLWCYEPLATKHSNQVSVAGFVTPIINVIKMPFNILYWVIQASGVSSFLWAVPYGLGALWVHYVWTLSCLAFSGLCWWRFFVSCNKEAFPTKDFHLP